MTHIALFFNHPSPRAFLGPSPSSRLHHLTFLATELNINILTMHPHDYVRAAKRPRLNDALSDMDRRVDYVVNASLEKLQGQDVTGHSSHGRRRR